MTTRRYLSGRRLNANAQDRPFNRRRVLIMRYETPIVCSTSDHRRAGYPSAWAPRQRGLYPASLPSPAAQRTGPTTCPDRRRPRLWHADRPRRPACLRPRGAGLPASKAHDSARPTRGLAQGPRRGSACLAASIAARPGQADQPVDAGVGRRSLPREGLDHAPPQPRDPAPGSEASGRRLEACQALADEPRPPVRAKKKLRDELIARAAARPDWVLGFQDETWWTRLAQPEVHAWTGDEPLRLLANERGGGKEALACYGLLRADTGAMLLRFVEGRPVSQVTEDYLGWLCQRFGREGKKVFVLVWDNAAWHVSKRVRRWIGAHNR